MAPHIKISSEEILSQSIKIIRKNGIEALNARSIAKQLKCSIQPIFRTFGTMEKLKTAVYDCAHEIYTERMEKAFVTDGFRGIGLAYIKFANDEKNIFRFLFMTNVFNNSSLGKIIGTLPNDGRIISYITKVTGLSKLKARELYTGMWFYSHGIASLLATNNCSFDKEAERIFENAYRGLLQELKQGSKNENNYKKK